MLTYLIKGDVDREALIRNEVICEVLCEVIFEVTCEGHVKDM